MQIPGRHSAVTRVHVGRRSLEPGGVTMGGKCRVVAFDEEIPQRPDGGDAWRSRQPRSPLVTKRCRQPAQYRSTSAGRISMTEAWQAPRASRDVRRVVVTGGAGFLGSHLCTRLISEGVEVMCLD